MNKDALDRRGFLGALGAVGGGALGVGAHAASLETNPAAIGYQGQPGILSSTTLIAAANAPIEVKRAADAVCTGSQDQQVINDAIAAQGAIGGVVQLSQGTFTIEAAIRMRRLVSLIGRGEATKLTAQGTWPSFDGALAQGGVIEPWDVETDKTTVAHLRIDGNQYQNTSVRGIYYNITVQGALWTGPDANHNFSDLYIHKTSGDAFHMDGGRNRGLKVARVRQFDIGRSNNNPTTAHGFYIGCPDGMYADCESGGATGHGFFVDGTNNHFSNCKAWFADLNGWQIAKPRGHFANCSSQDNQMHGFRINSGPNTLVSCHADSNSWNSQSPESSYDGFYLPGTNRVQLLACAAYDKNESQRGNWQRYGFNIANSCQFCQIIGVAQDNTAGSLLGGADPSNFITVQG